MKKKENFVPTSNLLPIPNKEIIELLTNKELNNLSAVTNKQYKEKIVTNERQQVKILELREDKKGNKSFLTIPLITEEIEKLVPHDLLIKLNWIILSKLKTMRIKNEDAACKIFLPFGEIYELLGISQTSKNNKIKVRKKIKNTLTYMQGISLRGYNYHTGAEYNTVYVASWKDDPNKRGIEIVVPVELVNNIPYERTITRDMFKLKERNPNKLAVLEYLRERYFNSTNKKTGNYNIIKLSHVLEHCPTLPTIKTVAESDQKYFRRIIEPIDEILNFLVDKNYLKSFEYCKSKKAPLTDGEIKNMYEHYKIWLDTYITYEIEY